MTATPWPPASRAHAVRRGESSRGAADLQAGVGDHNGFRVGDGGAS